MDGYSACTQISIALEDQDNITFTCPFGTFAFRRMPFGLCNAAVTFHHCIDFYIFWHDWTMYWSVYGWFLFVWSLIWWLFGQIDKSFANMLGEELDSNWKKYHFMIKKKIVLGLVISHDGIEVNKVKIDFLQVWKILDQF